MAFNGGSALFTVLLFVGLHLVTCDKTPFGSYLELSYRVWAVIYIFATGFALVDTITRYFYLFADRGTALQPRMSRGRVWILLGAILICVLALRWSATLYR